MYLGATIPVPVEARIYVTNDGQNETLTTRISIIPGVIGQNQALDSVRREQESLTCWISNNVLRASPTTSSTSCLLDAECTRTGHRTLNPTSMG